jgi:glyoxylase-like metal-dependent hydrolase (beta-lactamase superfamily II)
MSLEIIPFEAGPVATIGYLVIDSASKNALIVDAPLESAAAMKAAIEEAGARPAALVLTHTHWDHTGDAAALKRLYPEMLLYVHPDDEYRLAKPMEHSVWQLPFAIEGTTADRYLHEGDTLALDGICFKVLHTPGHTEGGICLYDAVNRILFAGDTLFEGSVGRTDLPGGSWSTLTKSIADKLLPLPDDVRVYPGHGNATTIGFERASNPFVGNLQG